MYRSHRQQVLQNYFDSTQVRTRENPYSIDAQLLNTTAIALDDAALRYSRELKGLQLPYCPTGLDNKGIYYSVQLDNNYSLASDATTLNSLVGLKNGVPYTLTLYNDTLPIPAGYQLDPLRSTVKIVNPKLTSFIGSPSLIILPQVLNQVMPITNRLTFWLSNTLSANINVDIVVYGTKYPEDPWQVSRTDETETLQLSNEGFIETINAWTYISKIVVRNLPENGILDCFSMSFGLVGRLDPSRPAVLPAFRGSEFDKYWTIDSGLLQEKYLLDALSGLVYYQSYNLSSPINCVAVEPDTWGGILGGQTTLYYFDRREPMPDLSKTGLSVEPCYGLDIFYDISYVGAYRQVVIRPIPYKNSSIVTQYRLICVTPSGNTIVILNNGYSLSYSSSAGWQSGFPITFNFPMSEIGQYVFTLQCLDQTGAITADVFPYGNFDITDIVKASFDISTLVANVESICFDFLGNLWVYDGIWAIPLQPYYNGYILDPASRTIYLTDKFDQVIYT